MFLLFLFMTFAVEISTYGDLVLSKRKKIFLPALERLTYVLSRFLCCVLLCFAYVISVKCSGIKKEITLL